MITMPKRKGNFNAWRLEKLADPVNAANYLSAALEDSPEIFLDAVKDVIQATSVSKIAQKANLTRESIYRSFSATGNPTLETLTSVLDALGLKLSKIAPRCGSLTSSPPLSGTATRRHKGRSKYGRRGLRDRSQLLLPFDSAWPAWATANATRAGNIGTIITASHAFGTPRVPQQVESQRSSEEWMSYVPHQQGTANPTYAYAQ